MKPSSGGMSRHTFATPSMMTRPALGALPVRLDLGDDDVDYEMLYREGE